MKNKITILALTMVSSSFLAQEVKHYEPILFESGSDKVVPFNNKYRKFNDWSISVGGGVPLLQSADITSINNYNGKTNIGYSFYASIDKAITHSFGLSLVYDRGETKQSNMTGTLKAKTQFDAVSLLGDVNFSNLFRRVDNRSPYRWAFHGYVGLGFLRFESKRQDVGNNSYVIAGGRQKDFSTRSMNFQAGTGVKYKINRRFDLGLRAMYVITHSDSFDGGGLQYSDLNMTEEQNSDNLFNFQLGLTYKIGKHASHLMWHDPMQEIYYKLDNVADVNVEVCKNGDKDNDGVCDDWDRQLDTPAGARVDGAGVALDTDLDGVIDLNDKCVTVPGPVSNNGCPEVKEVNHAVVANEIELALKDLLFVFDKTVIVADSYPKLDLAADYIKASNGGTFVLTGHTDKKGNDNYNLNLSRGRARAVVAELEKRGVNPSQLKSVGVGEQYAVIPETASNEERLQDRKVTVRYVSGEEWDRLPKSDVVPVKPVTKKVVKKKK